ncbi:hypothetical protein K438DRAFT_1778402 [Mycena galopus ATCC 62051]|nr:hypothetical protein K438DRAFT_1778402 [Mycena galopus ATCC 62051]
MLPKSESWILFLLILLLSALPHKEKSRLTKAPSPYTFVFATQDLSHQCILCAIALAQIPMAFLALLPCGGQKDGSKPKQRSMPSYTKSYYGAGPVQLIFDLPRIRKPGFF